MPPPLIKGRYGEPIITRIYNNLPVDRTQNGGFGRNEHQLHFHNAHNGAESDGAANVHHFPGTFYDYRWSTTLARRDKINTGGTILTTGGPDDSTGINPVPGDYREYQGTMWAHDHRFFFTAENVYKGMLMMINYYSAKDRGNEALVDGTNLRLPSGKLLGWGNIDFDVNLIMSDGTLDQDGQYFFDIFTTDGMIGDLPLVNFRYAPFMEVLPRKYRFRILNACMSRFFQFAIAGPTGAAVPFWFICQRRQPGRQPDHALEPRSAGHRRALRHHRRLLQVPHRRQAAPRRCLEANQRQQARRGGDPRASPAGRCRRPGARRHAAVPGGGLRAERGRAWGHPDHGQQLREQRQERGAAQTHRPDPGRGPGQDARGAVWPRAKRRFPRSGHGSMHPRLLGGGVQLPLDHQRQRPDLAFDERQPGVDGLSRRPARSSTGPTSTRAAAGITRSTCTSRKASP